MDTIIKRLQNGIIAHEPGWCPVRTIDLDGIDDLAQVVELEYHRCNLYEEVEAHCFSVTSGWRIVLRDSEGSIVCGRAEAYPSGPYPSTPDVIQACCSLIESWQAEVTAARKRRAEAKTWVAEHGDSIELAAIEVEAGRLGLAELAAEIGVFQHEIQSVIERRAGARYEAELAAEDDRRIAAYVESHADEIAARMDEYTYATAAQLAKELGTTAGVVRKRLSRADVGAVGYVGRYRTARYRREEAETALRRRP